MKVEDPICHMKVETEGARFVSERGGERFYFCCAACQTKFEAGRTR